MAFHIIDNKKVELSNDEWNMYQAICKSYDDGIKQKGSNLFCDLFETDEEGIIVLLRPPTRATSFEILFFLMSVMLSQHLRQANKQIDEICERVDVKLKELESKTK